MLLQPEHVHQIFGQAGRQAESKKGNFGRGVRIPEYKPNPFRHVYLPTAPYMYLPTATYITYLHVPLPIYD